MLALDNVWRSVDQRQVLLKEVSLRLEKGELVSVLGPTGSGKTTLLRLIMGLDTPDRGSITFDDQALSRGSTTLVQAEDRGFSLVFEKTVLLPFMSVEENLKLGCGDGVNGSQLQEVLDLLQLEPQARSTVEGMSAGEQQRLALARSLLVQPRLLMLDEPFRNIDRQWRDLFIPRFKRYLKQRHITTILVSHDRHEAFAFSDRIFLLQQGQLIRRGTPQQLYRRPLGPWDAQLLGDSNHLPMAVAQQLGYQPQHPEKTHVLVRPEQLAVETEKTAEGTNAELLEQRFAGFYQVLVFQVEQHRVTAKQLGSEKFLVGESYALKLAAGCQEHLVEVMDAP